MLGEAYWIRKGKSIRIYPGEKRSRDVAQIYFGDIHCGETWIGTINISNVEIFTDRHDILGGIYSTKVPDFGDSACGYDNFPNFTIS